MDQLYASYANKKEINKHRNTSKILYLKTNIYIRLTCEKRKRKQDCTHVARPQPVRFPLPFKIKNSTIGDRSGSRGEGSAMSGPPQIRAKCHCEFWSALIFSGKKESLPNKSAEKGDLSPQICDEMPRKRQGTGLFNRAAPVTKKKSRAEKDSHRKGKKFRGREVTCIFVFYMNTDARCLAKTVKKVGLASQAKQECSLMWKLNLTRHFMNRQARRQQNLER